MPKMQSFFGLGQLEPGSGAPPMPEMPPSSAGGVEGFAGGIPGAVTAALEAPPDLLQQGLGEDPGNPNHPPNDPHHPPSGEPIPVPPPPMPPPPVVPPAGAPPVPMAGGAPPGLGMPPGNSMGTFGGPQVGFSADGGDGNSIEELLKRLGLGAAG